MVKKKKRTSSVVPPAEQQGVIAVVLPGEVAVDEALIVEAVQEINRIHRAKGLEAARAIGEFLLATFFDGDIANAKSKQKKHLSFRALAARDDLNVSKTDLWYSVAILDQLRHLPTNIGDALPESHHRLLTAIKDVKIKAKLATEAVDQHLGKRELQKRIAQEQKAEPPKATKPGRPSLPSWAKGVGQIMATIEAAAADDLSAADVKKYGASSLAERLAEIDAAITALEALRAKLTAAKG